MHTNEHSNGVNGTNGHSETYPKTRKAMAIEQEFAAHNYHPLPVVFERALGTKVWDVDGNEYIDCLSAYSAMNQGHCHPKIVKALCDQASKLTLSSRAFYSSPLGPFAEKITKLLGFESVLPMNTGAEAVETAIKLARKWAYMKKGVPENKAIVFAATENFHGRTMAVISMSTDPECRQDFGPFLDRVGPICPAGKGSIRYNNIGDIERAFEAHGKEAAAIILEPIQGEAGIIVPDADYLERVCELCKKHNVLFICDEIQTGFGRTGKMLCFQHNPRVKPDIVTLGKALSGGVYPVSAVLSSKEIMNCIQPGQHGSTYGGNPVASAVSCAALDVLVDEKLSERAMVLGKKFRSELAGLQSLGTEKDGKPWIKEIRGMGLMNAIVIDETKSQSQGRGAWHLCLLMKERGLLAKPTHINTIRLAPPLVITEEEITRAVEIIKQSLLELDTREHIEDLSAHKTSFVSL